MRNSNRFESRPGNHLEVNRLRHENKTTGRPSRFPRKSSNRIKRHHATFRTTLVRYRQSSRMSIKRAIIHYFPTDESKPTQGHCRRWPDTSLDGLHCLRAGAGAEEVSTEQVVQGGQPRPVRDGLRQVNRKAQSWPRLCIMFANVCWINIWAVRKSRKSGRGKSLMCRTVGNWSIDVILWDSDNTSTKRFDSIGVLWY